jgi:hypothetical protein
LELGRAFSQEGLAHKDLCGAGKHRHRKLALTNSINAGFIVAAAESAAMSMRQQIMACVLGLSLIAMLGATAARDLTQTRVRDSMWLDPGASDGLLASRLNITNIAKTPRTR